jgi:acyl transferase domain-containing protein
MTPDLEYSILNGVPTHDVEDATMPIAIIGMSARLPGDATDPESLYKMCAEARDAWSTVPSNRFNHAAFYHPDANRNGTSNVLGAHFLQEDLALFDAPFFGMTRAEAAALDPQQRLLLEGCYEAFENAGRRMEDVVGSNTSVFVGSFCKDWGEVTLRDPGEYDTSFRAITCSC